MANDLTKLWGNFSLAEEESLGVELQEEFLEDTVHRGQTCVVGKLIADRVISKDTI